MGDVNIDLYVAGAKYKEVNIQLDNIPTPSDRDKAIIRVKVQGYTTDRNRISECLKDLLQDYQYYKDSQPDLTNLSTSISPERDYIASKVIETIKEIDLGNQSFPLKKDEIILAALKTIYEK